MYDPTSEPIPVDPRTIDEDEQLVDDEGEMLMLSTYIGFEFEGAALAEIFQTLDQEEQNEIRLMVEDLIHDYYEDLIEEEGYDRRDYLD